jgi:hypothetical protein
MTWGSVLSLLSKLDKTYAFLPSQNASLKRSRSHLTIEISIWLVLIMIIVFGGLHELSAGTMQRQETDSNHQIPSNVSSLFANASIPLNCLLKKTTNPLAIAVQNSDEFVHYANGSNYVFAYDYNVTGQNYANGTWSAYSGGSVSVCSL